MKKWQLVIKIGILAVALAAVKGMLNIYSYDVMSVTPLFLSVVGGVIFLLGFILSGTISDYKESEKIPIELANSVENIYEEVMLVKKRKFDVSKYKLMLLEVIDNFNSDLGDGKRKAVASLSRLYQEVSEIDSSAKIRAEISSMRKTMLRAYQIKETTFIPAAYAILEILAAGIIGIMLFTNLGTFYESTMIIALVSFFIVYMITLIKDIDDPFEAGQSIVDVDMFLLNEAREKIK